MNDHKDEFESDLISITAHDLKTPVSAARGFMDLILHSGPLNEAQVRYWEKAMSALDRMERIIVSLLDLARLEDGLVLEIETCDLCELAQEAVELLGPMAAQRNITIIFESAAGAVMLNADERLLYQVISNLISNAIKYNVDGGEVHVVARVERGQARLDVGDTGIGIPADELAQVFKRFYRTTRRETRKIEGTGLGLTIAEAIIEAHGGRIWVESVLDKGTTFSFVLPISSSKRTTRRGKSPAGRKTGTGHSGFNVLRGESASEQSDAVDDDSQESSGPEQHESDSQSDEV